MYGRIVGLILAAALVLGPGSSARGQQAVRSQPMIEVEQNLPQRVEPGEAVPIEIVVRNNGTAAAQNVTVVASLPSARALLDAAPQPERVSGALQWALGVVEPGGRCVVRVRLASQADGAAEAELRSAVKVTYQSSVQSDAVCVVRRPELALQVTGPDSALVGEAARIVIAVRNTGTAAVPDVMLQTVLPAGLSHPGGNDLESEVGTLKPGETRQITLAVTPTQAGEFRPRIAAVSRGATLIEHEGKLRVQEFKIVLATNGPRLLYQDWVGSFELVLRNDGRAAVGRLAIVAGLPRGLAVVRASDGGTYAAKDHRLHWELENLKPGESRTLVWNGVARGVGEQVCKVQLSAGTWLQEAVAWQTAVMKASGEQAPAAASAADAKPRREAAVGPASGAAPTSFPKTGGEVKWRPAAASPLPPPARVEATDRRDGSPSPEPQAFAVGWRTDLSK